MRASIRKRKFTLSRKPVTPILTQTIFDDIKSRRWSIRIPRLTDSKISRWTKTSFRCKTLFYKVMTNILQYFLSKLISIMAFKTMMKIYFTTFCSKMTSLNVKKISILMIYLSLFSTCKRWVTLSQKTLKNKAMRNDFISKFLCFVNFIRIRVPKI